MRIALAGPMGTPAFRKALGLKLLGAPDGVIQTPINTLGAELVRRGDEVTAICLDPSLEAVVRVSEGPLSLVYLPQRSRARSRASDLFVQEVELVRAELDRTAPDVVHAHWTYEYAEAAIRSRLPHLVTMHDIPLEVMLLFHNAYRAIRAAMAIRVLSRLKTLAVVSPRMAGWTRVHGYLGSLDVVPNGVDVPAMPPSHVERLSKPVRIVVVGDLSGRKNVSAAVVAFRDIRRALASAELHLFGAGLDAGYAAGESGVTGHGATPHDLLMDFLAREATLLLHPSIQETFGVIVAEALARGVPAIAGRRSGGVTFVMGDELTDLLVDVRRPEAMSRAVLALLSDPAAYARAAERGRARVQARFSTRGMTDSYQAIYSRVLAQQAQ